MLPGNRWSRLVFGALGASWLAGCNLIAGIDEGVLVDAAPDGGTHDSGHRVDATAPDAKGPDAKGQGDVRVDVAPPRDAPADAPPHDGHVSSDARDAASGPVACTPVAGPLSLQNLEHANDGGPATIGGQSLFIVSVGLNGPVIFAQLSTSTDDPVFFVDQPDNNDSAYNTLTVRGLQLYDAVGGEKAAQMLTSVGSPNSQSGLQVVTLPQSLGEAADAGWTLLSSPSHQYKGAQVVPVDAGTDAAFAYVALENVPDAASQTRLVMGPASPLGNPEATLFQASSTNQAFNTIWNDVLLQAGGRVVALIGSAASPDAGSSALATYSAPENDLTQVGPPGALSPPKVDAAFTAIIGAAPSAARPGDVNVLAVATNSMIGPFTFYGGTVQVADLGNLTVSVDGGFVSSVIETAPIGQGTPVWSADTMALAGGAEVSVDGNVQRQVGLAWIGLGTQVLATFSHDVDNPVTSAAVAFEPGTTTSPQAAVFDLVWVEQLSGEAGSWSALYFMSVACR